MPKERKIKLARFESKDFKTGGSHPPADVEIQQPDGVIFTCLFFLTVGRTRILRQHLSDKRLQMRITLLQMQKLRFDLGGKTDD